MTDLDRIERLWIQVTAYSLEIERNREAIEAQTEAVDKLRLTIEEGHVVETCPECQGENLSPHRLRYCRDCDAAYFPDSTPSESLDNLD